MHSNTATLDLIYSGLFCRSDSKLIDKPRHLFIISVKHWSIQACMMQYFFLPCSISYIFHIVLPHHVAQWYLPSVVDRYNLTNHLLLTLDPLIHFKVFRLLICIPCLSFIIMSSIHIHGKVTFLQAYLYTPLMHDSINISDTI